jgi:hypothetical protein
MKGFAIFPIYSTRTVFPIMGLLDPNLGSKLSRNKHESGILRSDSRFWIEA